MNAIARKVTGVSILDFGYDATERYGTYVIENRALPDFRDGLKPVQRRILWTMQTDHIHSNSPFKKSARIIGNAMGKFHPHGDAALYGAMVGISGTNEGNIPGNCAVPLILGQGNWGELNGRAAAHRYTEAKLSKYSDNVMLASEYLAVTPMMPNYDGLESEPLYLPSLLPTLLFNGIAGIAVGVITGIPSFHQEGVMKLVRLSLKKKALTPQLCAKYLKVNTQFGGKVLSSDQELLEFYKTGEGRLEVGPTTKIINGDLHILGASKYFNSEIAIRKFQTEKRFEQIVKIDDFGSEDEPIHLVVRPKKGLTDAERKKLFALCEASLSSGMNLRINVTERKTEDDIEFHSHLKGLNMPKLIEMWVKWRIDIEVAAQKFIAEKLRKEIEHQELLLLAANSLDIIKRELQRKTPDLDNRLAKALKITLAESQVILAMQVRRLSALSRIEIIKTIKSKKLARKTAIYNSKHPREKILHDIPHLTKIAFQ